MLFKTLTCYSKHLCLFTYKIRLYYVTFLTVKSTTVHKLTITFYWFGVNVYMKTSATTH